MSPPFKLNPDLIKIFNASLPSLAPLIISLGHLPPPSESQTGLPFSDHIPPLLPHSHSNQNVHHPSSTSTASTTQPSDLEISTESIAHPITQTCQDQIPPPNPSSQQAKHKIEEIDMELKTAGLDTTSAPIVHSVMSRKKEEWLIQLQNDFNQLNHHHHNDQKPNQHSIFNAQVNYPRVGDSFLSVEKFKEACLWASWTSGHDMHVRNHYRTEEREKCIFTCRYDRSPPKGHNCPFKIIAIYDKSETSGLWKVTHRSLTHQNHQITPGPYDPLTKKFHRKRRAHSSINEASSQQNSDLETHPSKRGKLTINQSSHQSLNNLDHHPDQSRHDEDSEQEQKEEEKENDHNHRFFPPRPQPSTAQRDELSSQTQNSTSRPRRSLAKYDPVPASSLIHGVH